MSKRIVEAVRFEETINKSRFITHLIPVDSELDAVEVIKRLSISDASHNCWAYRIDQVKRFNDDGEPAGTAGRPMLNILEGHELNYTLALCIRWYGGIKLGTGGLIRAYGNGVKQCIDQASIVEYVPQIDLYGFCPYPILDQLKARLSSLDALIIKKEYGAEGANISIKVADKNKTICKELLQGLSSGEYTFSEIHSDRSS